MAVSDKQLRANRKNAKKGGPKTTKGKAIVRRNALKHGLLAKEIVIAEGEGAESQEEFDALLADLVNQYKPEGTLEEMLVEKIAVCYWRLRRACRYEVGLIRKKLDNATEDYRSLKDHGKDPTSMTDQDLCDALEESQITVKLSEKDREKNKMALQVKKMLGAVPASQDLGRLLKYEGSIERQFYKAMNQLERLQRLRAGDNVPAPVKLDVDLNTPNMS